MSPEKEPGRKSLYEGKWRGDMENLMQKVVEMIVSSPGQGSVLEKLDKKIRKLERETLYKMLEQIKGRGDFVVDLYKHIPQVGRIRPAVLRFHLPAWRHYDEVFWRALGDYVILALRSIKDIEFDKTSAKLKIEYFATKKRPKSTEELTEIVRGLAILIDMEMLSTDFTHFRRMAERRGSLGEMKKEEAALLGVAFEMATSFLRR
jgi:hypothetical protein